MTTAEYCKDPCGASSLPFWKTEGLELPPGVAVIREDAWSPGRFPGRDEPYFKLIHRLERTDKPVLPEGYEWAACEDEELARHICLCYGAACVTPEELSAWRARPVYDGRLWLALRDRESGELAASGIAELDRRIGEGVLDWIQVSPEHRRRGLGRCVVLELLDRLRGRAAFVTVSGRLNSPHDPLSLYRACGFEGEAVWHVVTKESPGGSLSACARGPGRL